MACDPVISNNTEELNKTHLNLSDYWESSHLIKNISKDSQTDIKILI